MDGQPAPRRKVSAKDLDFTDLPMEPLTALQGGAALASGFNRAAIAGIAGLPAKTGADLIDLAKAAYGFTGGKLGLIDPNDLPQPLDRAKVIGSPEWIAAKIEGSGELGRAAIANPRPDNATARVLNAGGYAVGSGMSGRPTDMAMNAASGVAGQLAAEAGASPEWAMLASMGPQTAQQAAAASLRGTMRGGEAGRKEMEQRTAEFRAAGVEPTVGLATGKRIPQAIESTLSRAPGAAGVIAAKAESIRDQLGGTVNAQRDRVSDEYGPAIAGEAVKRGAEQYRTRQQEIYGELVDRALAKVPEDMRFPVANMLARGELTLADIEGAPNVTRVLNQPKGFTQDVLTALDKDASPQPPQQVPGRILQENGQPFAQEIPATPGGIGIDAIRGLRSRVGELAFRNNPLNADANTGALKALYGGAKQDLMTAAALADAERVKRGQQPGVHEGLSRADRFYSVTSDVLDNVLAPLHKTAEVSPERAYSRVEGMSKASGGNVQRLMASVPLDARRKIAATVIDELGKANPGGQNAEGTMFSPAQFLSNWNRLDPAAKTGIFLGVKDGGRVRDKLELVAKAAERIKDAGKVYANPSGTAGAAQAASTWVGLGAGVAGILTGNPTGYKTTGAILSVMGTSWGAAKVMTSPRFVDWLAQSTVVPPEKMRQHLYRLNLLASKEDDPEARAAMQDVAATITSQLGDEIPR